MLFAKKSAKGQTERERQRGREREIEGAGELTEIRLLAAFRANGNDQGHIEHDDANVAVAVAVTVAVTVAVAAVVAVRVNCRCFCLTLEGAFYSSDLAVVVAL